MEVRPCLLVENKDNKENTKNTENTCITDEEGE